MAHSLHVHQRCHFSHPSHSYPMAKKRMLQTLIYICKCQAFATQYASLPSAHQHLDVSISRNLYIHIEVVLKFLKQKIECQTKGLQGMRCVTWKCNEMQFYGLRICHNIDNGKACIACPRSRGDNYALTYSYLFLHARDAVLVQPRITSQIP